MGNQIRILSLDGSRLYDIGTEGCSVRNPKTKTIDYSRFEGVLDESLETIQLEKVYSKYYKKHKNEDNTLRLPFTFSPRGAGKDCRYSLALINVSFEYTIKDYSVQKTPHGFVYILDGYKVANYSARTDAIRIVKKDGGAPVGEIKDHVLIKEEDGKDVVLAIETPFNDEAIVSNVNDDTGSYVCVENYVSNDLLGAYFEYDADNKCYRRVVVKDKDGKEKDKPFITQTDSNTIRQELYTNGFICDGVKYVRYKRSAGSSRAGHCLFIPQVLYKEMMEWSSCGIDGNTVEDQASFQAYISLTLSSIEKTINLSQRSILLIPDQKSEFTTYAVRVSGNAEDELDANYEDVTVKNTIWDGEALLDESVFAENGLPDKGMMLLRNRFFKTCAFNTNLQQWFEDNGITCIKDLNGCHQRNAKLTDIKLVITESSLKYCKMLPKGMTLREKFDVWLKNAFDGKPSSDFGLVKTEKPTGLMGGNMVRANYQMINTVGLTEKETAVFLQDSFELLHNMMNVDDPAYLRYYINLPANADDPDDDVDATTINYRAKVTSELLCRNDDFAKTKFFREYLGDILKSFKRKMQKGRIPVDGTYATLFGNGAELLQAVIDKNYTVDQPLALQGSDIRTTQFDYGKELLCARSPHITMGNLYLAKNVNVDIYEKYFNFEKAHEIVCINAIGNNIQHRLNGCDYDSDTMLITDNPVLLPAAKRVEKYFPVPVGDFTENDVETKKYHFNNPAEIAELDRKIANNHVGEIVNLSQFLNSLYWDKIHAGVSHEAETCKKLYADNCKLAVLSGVEIDKAKRSNKVKSGTVLSKLRKEYKDKYREANGGAVPEFFPFLSSGDVTESEAVLNTAMSFIYDAVKNDEAKPEAIKNKNKKYTPLSALVSLSGKDDTGVDSHRKQAILNAACDLQSIIADCNRRMRGMRGEEALVLREEMDAAFEKAKKTVAKNLKNEHILNEILEELDNSKNSRYGVSRYYAVLVALLVFEKNHLFLKKMIQNANPQYNLVYTPDATEDVVKIYGYPHVKQPVVSEFETQQQ